VDLGALIGTPNRPSGRLGCDIAVDLRRRPAAFCPRGTSSRPSRHLRRGSASRLGKSPLQRGSRHSGPVAHERRSRDPHICKGRPTVSGNNLRDAYCGHPTCFEPCGSLPWPTKRTAGAWTSSGTFWHRFRWSRSRPSRQDSRPNIYPRDMLARVFLSATPLGALSDQPMTLRRPRRFQSPRMAPPTRKK